MFEFLKRKKEPADKPEEARAEPAIGNLETVESSDNVKMLRLFDHMNTPSGASVTEASANRVSTVWACTNILASAVASLPIPIFEKTGEERKKVDHPYSWLLNQEPNSAFIAATFWDFVQRQRLNKGDSINVLIRNRAGTVVEILPVPRDCVIIQKRPFDQLGKGAFRLKYSVKIEDKVFGFDQDDVLHFPGMGFDGVQGMSVIQWGARNGIGIAIKADEFAGKFYSQGAMPQFALKANGEFTEKQQTAFRDAWNRKYTGAGTNGIPLILTEGLDIQELTMSAEDAQLLESRKWQVTDICRAYGIPPFMVGETEKSTSWGTGIEAMGIGMVKYTLQGPHLRVIEQELNRKLFRSRQYFAEFNVQGLMRGDSKARAEYYSKALGGTQAPAWMTPNEVRKLENLPPHDDGDTLAKPEKKDASQTQEPGAEPGEPAEQ